MNKYDSNLRALCPGACIALVAPASPPQPENIDSAAGLLRSWGFHPIEMPHLHDVNATLPYLAGTDEDRAEDIMSAFTDAHIDAVMCARGGYGSARILPFLDANTLRSADAKPFFGSSDITALHDWLLDHAGRRYTWFSPMPATDAVLDDAAAADMLHNALIGHASASMDSHESQRCSVPITVHGRLRGGNLSLMAADATSCTSIRPKFTEQTILLIEDVHEEPYHIDEMLRQLVAVNYFTNVTGIMLGSWLDCTGIKSIPASASFAAGNEMHGSHSALDPKPPHTPTIISAVVTDVLAPLGIPIASGFEFGHGPAAHTLPLGAQTVLSIRPSGAEARFVISQRRIEQANNQQ